MFVIAALGRVMLSSPGPQVIVLAPTREVAVQIAQTCLWIGSAMPGLKAYAFIGGLSADDDVVKSKRCHVAVGTPGRMAWLIRSGFLLTKVP